MRGGIRGDCGCSDAAEIGRVGRPAFRCRSAVAVAGLDEIPQCRAGEEHGQSDAQADAATPAGLFVAVREPRAAAVKPPAVEANGGLPVSGRWRVARRQARAPRFQEGQCSALVVPAGSQGQALREAGAELRELHSWKRGGDGAKAAKRKRWKWRISRRRRKRVMRCGADASSSATSRRH